jgi:hypothetical protein
MKRSVLRIDLSSEAALFKNVMDQRHDENAKGKKRDQKGCRRDSDHGLHAAPPQRVPDFTTNTPVRTPRRSGRTENRAAFAPGFFPGRLVFRKVLVRLKVLVLPQVPRAAAGRLIGGRGEPTCRSAIGIDTPGEDVDEKQA